MKHESDTDEYKSYGDEKCNGEFFIDKQNGARHGDGGGKIAERNVLELF